MRLLVTGGTGFIGQPLCRALLAGGHEVMVVTRHPAWQRAQPRFRAVSWEDPAFARFSDEMDAVINLAGEPVDRRRWTPRQKTLLKESRLGSTRRLIQRMACASRKPAVLISGSAIGYYGPREDAAVTEADSPGSGFLAELCQAWEAEASQAERLGVRVVRLRIGVVLGAGGGALPKMALPFYLFLGGPVGHGRQVVSWVHQDDVIGIILWLLSQPNATGAVNATAPHPVTMRELACELGRVLRKPSWVLVPPLALRLLLGEMAGMLLEGQRVMPRAALDAGYRFRFPELGGALEAALGRSRNLAERAR